MSIENLLLKKRSAILEKWFNLILESYPPESSKFFNKEMDRFSNPVAHQITQGIAGIYDAISEGKDPGEIRPFLDEIIRIRAVQELSPSEAVSFFTLLKGVVREELKSERAKEPMPGDLLRFESKLDDLTFMSFDVYMKCREKLFELKVNDVKNRVSGLLRMSGLATELEETNSKDSEGKMTKCGVQANEF